MTSLGAGGPRSLSCRSGSLSRTEGWGYASGVQRSRRDLWPSSCRVNLLKSCLSQGKAIVAPEECGSGPTAGVWRLQSGVISLHTVSSWGPGHTAQVREADRASFKGLIPLGSREETGILILIGRCLIPLPSWFLLGLMLMLLPGRVR